MAKVLQKEFDVGAIAAWLGLASTVAGGLAALVESTGSVWSPIDTGFIFLFIMSIGIYVTAVFTVMLAGGIGLLLERVVGLSEDGGSWFVVVLVISGICSAAVWLPAMWEFASETVQTTEVRFIGGLTGVRIVGTAILVGIGYLIWRYLVREKPASTD